MFATNILTLGKYFHNISHITRHVYVYITAQHGLGVSLATGSESWAVEADSGNGYAPGYIGV